MKINKLIEYMKGWTVKTAVTKNGAKGIAARHVYLFNEKHINHQNTEKIIKVFGDDIAMTNIVYYAEHYAAEQRMSGRGGRPPSSYAMEFTLNLPKGYRPTEKQWQGIVIDCINALAKCCNVGGKELASSVLAVLHQQNYEGKGTGDHVHLFVGKFTANGKFLKNLQRKTATHVLKSTFNDSTRTRCGYDWTEYAKRIEQKKHQNKINLPTWEIKKAREYKFLDDKLQSITSLADQLDEKLEQTKDEKKLLGKLQGQFLKWIEARDKGDSIQENRQYNRINKTLSDLSTMQLSSGSVSIVRKISEQVSNNSKKKSDFSL